VFVHYYIICNKYNFLVESFSKELNSHLFIQTCISAGHFIVDIIDLCCLLLSDLSSLLLFDNCWCVSKMVYM